MIFRRGLRLMDTFAPPTRGTSMGKPVVHFEIIAKDVGRVRAYYSGLFGWEIDANNPMNYGTIPREGNTNADGVGIGGGIGESPEGYDGHVTFYVEVEDMEATLQKAESLGGTRRFGPDQVPGMNFSIGQFTDPEGRPIGLIANN
jgi:predicted enzyme related to lactoylglutathione lyase